MLPSLRYRIRKLGRLKRSFLRTRNPRAKTKASPRSPLVSVVAAEGKKGYRHVYARASLRLRQSPFSPIFRNLFGENSSPSVRIKPLGCMNTGIESAERPGDTGEGERREKEKYRPRDGQGEDENI